MLIKIPSALLSRRAFALTVLPIIFLMNPSVMTTEGVHSFLVRAGILISRGVLYSESLCIDSVILGIAVITTPPGNAAGE